MVATDTIARPSKATAEQVAPPGGRVFGYRAVSMRFGQFAAGSVVSTLISQIVLTGSYWLFGTGAATASILAFVAGAIPNFLINWHWTWARRGRPALLRELVPYLAITIGGGLAATMLTTFTDHLISPLIDNRGPRTLVLDLVYLGSYGVLFVAKFTLLDRLLATRRAPNRARLLESIG